MKIAIFTYSYGVSGSGAAVRELSKFLVSKGHTVSVYDSLGHHDINSKSFKPHPLSVTFKRLFRKILNTVLKIPLKHRAYVNLSLFQSSIIKMPADYDFYNFHWIHNDFISLTDIMEIPPEKIVITQHDYWWVDGLHNIDLKSQKLPRIYSYIRDKNLSQIRKLVSSEINIIFPSKWLFSEFTKLHSMIRARTMVAFNIIDFDTPIPDSEELSCIEGSDSFKVAIAAWDISWYKGGDSALKVLEKLNRKVASFELHVYGSGNVHFNLDHAQKVISHGRLTQSKLFLQLSQMDALLYCSRFDNLPNLLVEASLLKLPVVCFDVGGCSEVIEHGVNGFVHEGTDFEGAAKSLAYIYKKNFQPRSTVVHNRITASKTFHEALFQNGH